MSDYVPPLSDIRFVLSEVAGLEELLAGAAFESVDIDTVFGVLDEAGRFIADVIGPVNVAGDKIGATWADGAVTTPDGFQSAYAQYVESGFGAAPFDPEFGGGGLPWVFAVVVQEMMTSACMSLALCPLLTQGAIDALSHHGTKEQQLRYLPKMLTGEWTGTMNLTEPQAGSDVGALTTKAEPVGDGSYRIAGQKIYITYGEHDLAENIIHLVLARTPGSPPGTKGISMFVVPKYIIGDDGSLGERNDVTCVSIEHKLGIHGSPTCVLAFGDNEGAIGWLVGDEGDGMRNMFTMMNNARLSVGLQGLALAERAYQQAVRYAAERVQGTAVGAKPGTKSPIVDHADVRRLLMTQRSWIDAMRCLIYENAAALDRTISDPENTLAHQEWADLLIPISKSLCTDLGNELTSMAVQVHGGMGFVEETGIAQHYRDIRIAAIYEGTNGIQAADLVARKLSMRDGDVVGESLDRAEAVAREISQIDSLQGFSANLIDAVDATRRATDWLLANGKDDLNHLLAGSSPYLRMLGTVLCGGLMAKQALAGNKNLEAEVDVAFNTAKFVSAKFFGEQILPTAGALEAAVTAGADDLFALTPGQLA